MQKHVRATGWSNISTRSPQRSFVTGRTSNPIWATVPAARIGLYWRPISADNPGDMRTEAGAGGSVRDDRDEVVVTGFTAPPGMPDAGGTAPKGAGGTAAPQDAGGTASQDGGRPAAILEAVTLAAERFLSSP